MNTSTLIAYASEPEITLRYDHWIGEDGYSRIRVHDLPKGMPVPFVSGAILEDPSITSFDGKPCILKVMNRVNIEWALQALQREVKTWNELLPRREALRTALLANVLVGQDDKAEVTIQYSGYGDSGQIEECDTDHPGLSEFLWDVMWAKHSGFENDMGGNGTVRWDLINDKITIDHNDIYESYDNTVTEL